MKQLLLGVTLVLNFVSLAARADADLSAEGRLRANIRAETTRQCLLGNFAFKSDRLKKQLAGALVGIDTSKIDSCFTLGKVVGAELDAAQIAELVNLDLDTLEQRRRALLAAESTEGPSVKTNGKIYKAIINGIYECSGDYQRGMVPQIVEK